MTLAYIGLGSNMSDREAKLSQAVRLISQIAPVLAASSLYLTEPEGYKDQPDFLNSVVCVDTDVTAAKLLHIMNGIEVRMGRERLFAGAPRVIDLDLLLFDEAIINQPGLEVPHPRLHLRAFVLMPMVEIAPDLVHPVLHKTMKELLAGLTSDYRIDKWVGNKHKGSG